jgi:hypothetical protein
MTVRVLEHEVWRVDEIEALLAVPGMGLAFKAAPVLGVAIWLFVTVSLFRGGFRDLTERMTRPRWAGPERARAAAMIPLRALMLAAVAGFAAVVSVLGLMFNAAVILNVVAAVRGL